MTYHRATVFECENANLVGVAEIPPEPRRTGVLVVTGGPQYRVGSHRQFALLCRGLASHGFASLRFDFRGSGDSKGSRASFENIQPDIAAATGQLLKLVPQLTQVVLLGLCDGASAASMYAHKDPRVAGVVMLNPWVRTSGSLEQARIRSYYPSRLTSGTFWKRLLTGKVNVIASLKSLRKNLSASKDNEQLEQQSPENRYLQDMLAGVRAFDGKWLIILSANDMTAQEYRDLLASADDWRSQMATGNVEHREIAEANHTFASKAWRDEVAAHSLEFLQRLDAQLANPQSDI